MPTKPLIYVAGPLSKGDHNQNVRRAVLVAEALVEAGADVFIPHTHGVLWDMATAVQHPHEFWMGIDLAILEKCDGLVRVPGESKGADLEVAAMLELNRPVYSIPSAHIHVMERTATPCALQDRELLELQAMLDASAATLRHWVKDVAQMRAEPAPSTPPPAQGELPLFDQILEAFRELPETVGIFKEFDGLQIEFKNGVYRWRSYAYLVTTHYTPSEIAIEARDEAYRVGVVLRPTRGESE